MSDVWFIPLRPGMTQWENGSTGVSIAKHCDKHYCEDWHLHIHRGAGSAGTDLTRRDVAALRDALDALLEGESDEWILKAKVDHHKSRAEAAEAEVERLRGRGTHCPRCGNWLADCGCVRSLRGESGE